MTGDHVKSARIPGPAGVSVSRAIRAAMGAQRLNQAELVRRAGIPQSTLSKILADKRDLGIDEYLRICSALALNPGQVLDEAAEYERSLTPVAARAALRPGASTRRRSGSPATSPRR